MDFMESNLVCKAKSVVSTLFGIMLWTSTSPSPMRFPKEWSAYPGLKNLVHYSSQGLDPNLTHPCYHLHSYMIPAPSAPSSTTSQPLLGSLTKASSYSSFSSALDDLIGAESGVCMNSNIEEEIGRREILEAYHNQGKRKQRYAMRKEYPPPIPSLARTRNLPGHMPWILTRHYIDGKLVLIEERVKHHEYFEAHRENGRLVLNLVPVDDKVTCSHFVCKDEEEEELQGLDFFEEKETERSSDQEFIHEEEEGRESYQEIEIASDDYVGKLKDSDEAVDDEVKSEKLATASVSLPKSSLKNGSKNCGDLRKCFTYGGRMISEINLPCNSNVHRNAAGECMNIHSGSAPLDFGNICYPMTTVV